MKEQLRLVKKNIAGLIIIGAGTLVGLHQLRSSLDNPTLNPPTIESSAFCDTVLDNMKKSSLGFTSFGCDPWFQRSPKFIRLIFIEGVNRPIDDNETLVYEEKYCRNLRESLDRIKVGNITECEFGEKLNHPQNGLAISVIATVMDKTAN